MTVDLDICSQTGEVASIQTGLPDFWSRHSFLDLISSCDKLDVTSKSMKTVGQKLSSVSQKANPRNVLFSVSRLPAAAAAANAVAILVSLVDSIRSTFFLMIFGLYCKHQGIIEQPEERRLLNVIGSDVFVTVVSCKLPISPFLPPC